jgi:hypothetical protein
MEYLPKGPWRTKALNRAGTRVVVREYADVEADLLGTVTGGLWGKRGSSAEHIAILTHAPMLVDLLVILAGRSHELSDLFLGGS